MEVTLNKALQLLGIAAALSGQTMETEKGIRKYRLRNKTALGSARKQKNKQARKSRKINRQK
jgi:hypothetical protein